MIYVVEDTKYHFSYTELKEDYIRYCSMADEVFLKNIPAALHCACFICYFKEVSTEACLSDKGIIHELIHLNHLGFTNNQELAQIRKLFETVCKLD